MLKIAARCHEEPSKEEKIGVAGSNERVKAALEEIVDIDHVTSVHNDTLTNDVKLIF